MNHGEGGPATNEFNALTALDARVEKGVALDKILAKSPQDARRSLAGAYAPACPFLMVSTYKGGGDIEDRREFRVPTG